VGFGQMNRQEKRRIERQNEKKEKMFYMTEKQHQIKAYELLQKYMEDLKLENIKSTLKLLFPIIALSLHDKFGFGEKRINKIIDKIKLQFDCINSNHLSFEDLKNECEKFNIKFDWNILEKNVS